MDVLLQDLKKFSQAHRWSRRLSQGGDAFVMVPHYGKVARDVLAWNFIPYSDAIKLRYQGDSILDLACEYPIFLNCLFQGRSQYAEAYNSLLNRFGRKPLVHWLRANYPQLPIPKYCNFYAETDGPNLFRTEWEEDNVRNIFQTEDQATLEHVKQQGRLLFAQLAKIRPVPQNN